jgi:thiol-disulfide isomerase/thioredoxin
VHFKTFSGGAGESCLSDWKLCVVVDVHSTWCGPCKAIVPTFQRLYLDLNDRPIKFLVVRNSEYLVGFFPVLTNRGGCNKADAEKIAALKDHAGRSKPLFLFYKVS